MKIFTRSRQDLAAISARSRRVFGRRDFPHLAAIRDHGRDRGEITARYRKSRRPKTRCDLAAILAEMREISAAKNAPRSRHDSCRDRSEIWKTRQANRRRDVAARSWQDTEILAAKTHRGLGGSCRGLRLETKFLAVKIFLLSRREAKFSAAKIGSIRTIFTFTLTINQTTRR